MSHAQAVADATSDIDFSKNNYSVELDTTYGKIKLDLWPDVAPNHCKNIIGLARSGFYDGLIFHRIIDGFMIQGGCPDGKGTGGPGYNVNAEFNDSKHEEGVLSMARSGDPHSAGSQFFICLDRHHHLDGNYTAFGKTADEASVAVVREIGAVATNASDRPLTDVVINSATVTETAK